MGGVLYIFVILLKYILGLNKKNYPKTDSPEILMYKNPSS
jgi:hypothetical protein